MSQSVDQKKAVVLQFDPGQAEPLPFKFFNNRSRKSTKLINNQDESDFLDGRNHAYWFDLNEPVFLNQIDVEVDGYSKYKSLEFKWKTLRDTEPMSSKQKIDDNVFSVEINDIVTAFCIKPPTQYFSDPKLKSITVYGTSVDQLNSVMDEFGKLDETKAALRQECDKWVEESQEAEALAATLTEKSTALRAEIAQFETKRTNAAQETEEAESALEKAETNLVAKRSEESDVTSRIEKIEDGIDQKKKESEALNTDITEQSRQLKSLKDDVNMFPSEISGYVKQGSKNIRLYTALAFVPISILIGLVYALFSKAVFLTTIFEKLDGADLWTMFFSRIPFAIISIFIIHACYKIAKMFILEVIRISNRRLDLTKVSIVAKDVSDTSARNLEFTDDEIYELNTKLKMDMLKSHLKGYVSDDYEHDIDISLWDRFMKAITKKRKTEE